MKKNTPHIIIPNKYLDIKIIGQRGIKRIYKQYFSFIRCSTRNICIKSKFIPDWIKALHIHSLIYYKCDIRDKYLLCSITNIQDKIYYLATKNLVGIECF